MFHVGRFDPSAEGRKPKTVKPNAKEKTRRGTKRSADKGNVDITAPRKRGGGLKSSSDRAETNETATPTASDSSSVPSSSDDEEESQQAKPTTLKVIAPSQPISDDARKRAKKRVGGGAEDEAIDDFDADFDIIESRDDAPKSKYGPPSNTVQSAASRALKLSQLPIEEVASAKHWDLPSFLVQNLEADSYETFFPIQCMVIPDVIESDRNAHLRGARDVCCHAPTGSGKTLAFVLPLLTALSREPQELRGVRGVRRLQALVILPGRDLAKQVYDVFLRYARGSHIKIGLAVGGGKKKSDLVSERRSLVVEKYHESFSKARDSSGAFVRRKNGGLLESAAARSRHKFDPTSIDAALEAHDGTTKRDNGLQMISKMGGKSAIDILVATPGRLIDHLDSTPGFTLQHLRFLVIDEADRLVNQPYQNWVSRVLEASNSSNGCDVAKYAESPLQVAPDGATYVIDPITHRRTGTNKSRPNEIDASGSSLVSGGFGCPVPLRKMLFSATLTQDPQKLARLGLDNPKHYDANFLKRTSDLKKSADTEEKAEGDIRAGRYFVPEGLSEQMVECTAEQKPLVLLALLLDEQNKHVHPKSLESDSGSVNLSIVFTSSVDSTHRLARLLQLLWEAGGFGQASDIVEFLSSISAKQCAAILRRCRSFLYVLMGCPGGWTCLPSSELV
ncbi:hypothetical protein ACHAWF_015333 [Thalassiosira exigua]